MARNLQQFTAAGPRPSTTGTDHAQHAWRAYDSQVRRAVMSGERVAKSVTVDSGAEKPRSGARSVDVFRSSFGDDA